MLPLLCQLWLALSTSLASEPLVRMVTADDGLRTEGIFALEQAADGRIWMGTAAGVWRYDGRTVEPIGGLRNTVLQLIALADGRMIARDEARTFFTPTEDGAERWTSPDDTRLLAMAAGHAGEPVALTAEGMWVQEEGGWRALPLELPEGARALWAGPPGEWIISDGERWWRVSEAAPPAPLAPAHIAEDVEPTEGGGLYLADWDGVRWIDPDGLAHPLMPQEGRKALAERDGQVWAASAGEVRTYRQGMLTSRIGRTHQLVHSGEVIVDREGSVWLGTYRGLAQLPEPDATLWTAQDGLPGDTARRIQVIGSRLWVSTWSGASSAALHPLPDTLPPVEGVKLAGALCADGQERLWAPGSVEGQPVLARISEDELRTWPVPAPRDFFEGCTAASDGTVWMTAGADLWRTDATGELTRVGPLPVEGVEAGVKNLLEDGAGRLWLLAGQQACVSEGGSWRCVDLPGLVDHAPLHEAPSGRIWALVRGVGVVSCSPDACARIPGMDDLLTDRMTGIAPAVNGGAWVLGHATVIRVREALDTEAGWVIEEELGPWLGHLVSGPQDLHETAAGALWISHDVGLTHIPTSARQLAPDPPPVNLAALTVDGEPVDGTAIALPRPTSRVGLRVAAAAYRVPELVRYRLRVDDGPWEEAVSDGSFSFRGLPSGRHTLAVAASANGVHWSEEPVVIEVTVPPPWHARWDVRGLVLALLAAAALVLRRLRVRNRRREWAMRSRIARDLHDEVGAGFGSIGLLADLLATGPAEEVEPLAEEIKETAQELSTSMRGIVWSLRPEAATLGALSRYLADRARAALPKLAAQGQVHAPVLTTDTSQPVDLDVLRAVQLIALEALHNIARHAQASAASVVLERDGRRWVLRITDDGRGRQAAARPAADAGLGLSSMQQRAQSIGGELTIRDGATGGTVVELTFTPRRHRWPWSRR